MIQFRQKSKLLGVTRGLRRTKGEVIMLRIGKLRIRKIFTPQWEWEFYVFPDGTWQIALGRILIYSVLYNK